MRRHWAVDGVGGFAVPANAIDMGNAGTGRAVADGLGRDASDYLHIYGRRVVVASSDGTRDGPAPGVWDRFTARDGGFCRSP